MNWKKLLISIITSNAARKIALILGDYLVDQTDNQLDNKTWEPIRSFIDPDFDKKKAAAGLAIAAGDHLVEQTDIKLDNKAWSPVRKLLAAITTKKQ